MIEVEQAVLEALVRERACRRPPGAFHLCLVLESSRGNGLYQVETEEAITFQNLLLLSSERRQPSCPVPIPISTETEEEPGYLVREMPAYATDIPEDTERPSLQVIRVAPQHIILFLSFNLTVSAGKLFWSPHPAVKHAHYSIMQELYLKLFF